MKANELRIGNLVIQSLPFGSDEILTVSLSNISSVDVSDNWFPIPLTEEWLLKFGFENFDYGVHLELNVDLVLRLIISNGEYYPQLEKAPEFSSEEYQCIGLERLDYVHQLQNLYFTLTGNELKQQ